MIKNHIEDFKDTAEVLRELCALMPVLEELEELPLTRLTPHTRSLRSHLTVEITKCSNTFIASIPDVIVHTQVAVEQHILPENDATERLSNIFMTALRCRRWIPDIVERTQRAVREGKDACKGTYALARIPVLGQLSFSFGKRADITKLLADAEKIAIDRVSLDESGSEPTDSPSQVPNKPVSRQQVEENGTQE